MNVGVVAYRYGKALLKYVQENGSGEKVYSQALQLVGRMSSVEQLRDVLENRDDVSLDRKVKLLEAALEYPLEPELLRFVHLVYDRRRLDLISRMLHSFIDQYRESNNIRTGHLVTAIPADGLKRRLESIFSEKTGAEVSLSEDVDPDIMGGFIFDLGDFRLDASVESRLRKIRDGLIEKNNRIV